MENQDSNQVTVVDVKMPFWSMVVLMVKWAIASIPALIILAVVGAVGFGILASMFSGIGRY